MTSIVFYGSTSGWGKLTRIAAIARHLPDSLVVTVRGGNANVPLDYFGIDWHTPNCDAGCQIASPQMIANDIADLAPDVLVMDAWPFGQYSELTELVGRRDPATNVYVYRINPTVTADVAPFFSLVLATEDGCPVDAIDVQPCLPFGADELMSRTDARAALGGDERPLVLMPRSQYQAPNLDPLVTRVCAEHNFNLVRYDDYPLMTVMPGADVVVGYAGWITVEAAALGVPTITVATAFGSHDQPERANCRTAQDIRDRFAAVTVLDHIETYTDRSQVAADAIIALGGTA